MSNFTDWLAVPTARRRFCFRVDVRRQPAAFTITPAQTNTYDCTEAREIVSVTEDGAALTLRTSIATVEANAGSWWWDASASKVYVHTTDSADPDTHVTLIIHRLYLSDAAGLPLTLAGDAAAHWYDPRVQRQPRFRRELRTTWGAVTTGTGDINLHNGDQALDWIISEGWRTRGGDLAVYLGGPDLADADYGLLLQAILGPVEFAETSLRIQVLDQLDRLRRPWPEERSAGPEGKVLPKIYGPVNVMPAVYKGSSNQFEVCADAWGMQRVRTVYLNGSTMANADWAPDVANKLVELYFVAGTPTIDETDTVEVSGFGIGAGSNQTYGGAYATVNHNGMQYYYTTTSLSSLGIDPATIYAVTFDDTPYSLGNTFQQTEYLAPTSGGGVDVCAVETGLDRLEIRMPTGGASSTDPSTGTVKIWYDQAITHGDVITQLAQEGGFAPGDITGQSDLDTLYPQAVAAHYTEQTTLAAALLAVSQSCLGMFGVTRAADFIMGAFTGPTGTPVLTVTEVEILDLRIPAMDLRDVYWSVVEGWGGQYADGTADDYVTTSSDAGALVVEPDSAVFNSGSRHVIAESDAQDVGDDLLAILTALGTPIEITLAVGAYQLGLYDVITVQTDRYGWSAGVDVLILGLDEDWTRNTVTITGRL